MNEQLQNALSSILNSSANAIGTAKDFLVAEIPDVVYQLLLWKAIQSAIAFAICVVVIVVWIYFITRLYKWAESIGEEAWIAFAFGSFLTGAALFSIAECWMNLNWLQIWIAPKIYLLEYAAKLVTK